MHSLQELISLYSIYVSIALALALDFNLFPFPNEWSWLQGSCAAKKAQFVEKMTSQEGQTIS